MPCVSASSELLRDQGRKLLIINSIKNQTNRVATIMLHGSFVFLYVGAVATGRYVPIACFQEWGPAELHRHAILLRPL